MAITNEELETMVKNLLKQNQKEQNQEWREMVEDMVDYKLKLVEANWKQNALEKNKNDEKVDDKGGSVGSNLKLWYLKFGIYKGSVCCSIFW